MSQPDCNRDSLVCPAITWAEKEIGRLRATIRLIAGQMKSDELGEDDGDDFEGAYDAMIEDAREALAGEQAAPQSEPYPDEPSEVTIRRERSEWDKGQG